VLLLRDEEASRHGEYSQHRKTQAKGRTRFSTITGCVLPASSDYGMRDRAGAADSRATHDARLDGMTFFESSSRSILFLSTIFSKTDPLFRIML